MPARVFQQRPRPVGAASTKHEDGNFQVAPGALQCFARLMVRFAGQVLQHAFLAPGQLLVRGLHFQHQSAVHPAQSDHDQRRQKCERNALRRSRVHARRPCNGLRACLQEDGVLSLAQQGRGSVVGKTDRQRAQGVRPAQTFEGEGGRTARCDGYHCVTRTDAMLRHQRNRLFGCVFGTLHRACHGVLAARDQQNQPIVGPSKGRHQLGAILHSEAA
jgi:hypothetical protein